MADKIMLVEDDTNLSEIYKARLEAEGLNVITARDGEEALAMAVKEHPVLIISDVMMPKISGFDMLDILRGTEGIKNTKVIMMTALGQAEDKERAAKLGADRYLVKSQVTLEDVVKAVHEVMGDQPPPAVTAANSASSAPGSTPAVPVNISGPADNPITNQVPPDTAAAAQTADSQSSTEHSEEAEIKDEIQNFSGQSPASTPPPAPASSSDDEATSVPVIANKKLIPRVTDDRPGLKKLLSNDSREGGQVINDIVAGEPPVVSPDGSSNPEGSSGPPPSKVIVR